MLRLIERVLGEGDVSRDGVRVLRAGYELALYQNWDVVDGTLVPGHHEVEGHLMASPADLEPLLGTTAPLTLALDDGRLVDVYVLNLEGAVTPADARGFYRLTGEEGR
jgi:hypothetical protein